MSLQVRYLLVVAVLVGVFSCQKADDAKTKKLKEIQFLLDCIPGNDYFPLEFGNFRD